MIVLDQKTCEEISNTFEQELEKDPTLQAELESMKKHLFADATVEDRHRADVHTTQTKTKGLNAE